MEVKLKTFDIRKPQVSIGTKPFLTVEKTVRETAGTTGLSSAYGVAYDSINGDAGLSEFT